MRRRKTRVWLEFLLTVFLGAIAFLFVAPRLFGMEIYAVASGSMEPTYPVGSLIFIRKAAPGEIAAGDCITYSLGKGTITHRVMAVDEKQHLFFTKGDANQQQDRPVEFPQLLGKAGKISIPYLGYLVIGLKSMGPWGLAGLLGLVLLAMIFWNFSMLRRLRRRKKYEEE